jgi:hypothetical protein
MKNHLFFISIESIESLESLEPQYRFGLESVDRYRYRLTALSTMKTV